MGDQPGWVRPLAALGRRTADLTRGVSGRFLPASRARSMAVMAHQDDDLYFLNPLLVSQLHSSEAHLTVCLTAGEADGRNAPGGTQEHSALPVDFQSFAAARFNGLRRAYADMVLGDRDAKWRREGTTLACGAEADVSILVDASHVQLVSVNLWCKPPPDAAPGAGGLPELWTGQAESTPTMIPLGSPVEHIHSYSRESLIESLVMLLRRFEPTLLWTMDPDPDLQVHNRANPQYADSGNYSDHIDHTAAGLFAHEAATRWFAEGGGRRTSVEAFRGYYVRRWPSNLSPEARARKQRYKDVYGWSDGRPGHDPAGLGDRKVGRRSILAEIEREFPAEHARTVRSRFRSATDLTITYSLHHYYAFLTGRALPGHVNYGYVQLAVPDLAVRLKRAEARRDWDTFCINDAFSTYVELQRQMAVLEPFFEAYFPVPSPYESTGQR